MPPDLECLGEAVDVLGNAELVDSVFLGGGQIVIDVLLAEVLLRRADLVGAEVQVVVGQHAPKLPGVRAI
jgi:hypothetical protein